MLRPDQPNLLYDLLDKYFSIIVNVHNINEKQLCNVVIFQTLRLNTVGEFVHHTLPMEPHM